METTVNYLRVAVCTGEHVINVNSMPMNKRGATTYSSLQSDIQMPWNAPIGGPVAFIHVVKFGVMVENSAGVVVGGTVVRTDEFSCNDILYIRDMATQVQLLYI